MAYLNDEGVRHLWNKILNLVSEKTKNKYALPPVTEADNGKVLMVVDGKWQAVTLNLTVDENGVVSV